MPAANKLYYSSEKSQKIETCLTQEFPKYLEPQTKKKKKRKNVLVPQMDALRNILREMLP